MSIRPKGRPQAAGSCTTKAVVVDIMNILQCCGGEHVIHKLGNGAGGGQAP